MVGTQEERGKEHRHRVAGTKGGGNPGIGTQDKSGQDPGEKGTRTQEKREAETDQKREQEPSTNGDKNPIQGGRNPIINKKIQEEGMGTQCERGQEPRRKGNGKKEGRTTGERKEDGNPTVKSWRSTTRKSGRNGKNLQYWAIAKYK